jgi:serine phosphatase RsbU (regulator of sigma subunit)
MYLSCARIKRNIELKDGELSIGRSSHREVVLDDRQVSRTHFRVEIRGAEMRVVDPGSRNKTYLNGRDITEKGWQPLRLGDWITVLHYKFRVVDRPVEFSEDDSAEDYDSSICIMEEGPSSGASDAESRSISISSMGKDGDTLSRRLRALLAIIRTLRDVIHTEDVLERAVAILFEIFPNVERGAICIRDERSGELQPRWWKVRPGLANKTIQISQTIAKQVMETKEALLTHDAQLDFEGKKSVAGTPIRSVMCCPLFDAEDEAFGLILIDATQANVFNEADLELLAAVAMQLSLAINCARLHALTIRLTVEEEVLRLDMERARKVQERYLPEVAPNLPGYDIAGFYRPARHVGGDYIDYLPLPDGRLAIVLGDVVGKGVPAALTMVRLATETRSGLDITQSPKELVQRINEAFVDDFITFIVLLLEPATNQLTVCNAGHLPPLRRSCDGRVSQFGLKESGVPLGVLDDFEYEQVQLTLDPGDTLVVFSDGLPDQENNGTGERVGFEPISQWLAELDTSSKQTVGELVDRVDRFAEATPQSDDMCMVCLKRQG